MLLRKEDLSAYPKTTKVSFKLIRFSPIFYLADRVLMAIAWTIDTLGAYLAHGCISVSEHVRRAGIMT